ncbi:MAG: hypothetical protein ACOX52_03325 [Verrucomicrobiota bacterium]
MNPTHPHSQIENATATSAGDSPDPDGKDRLGMRRPFRTTSGQVETALAPLRLCARLSGWEVGLGGPIRDIRCPVRLRRGLRDQKPSSP